MAEPTMNSWSPELGCGWRCVLCDQLIDPRGAHYCAAEARIREIIREELARSVTPQTDNQP